MKKIVIVTGSSTGIGRECAERLAKSGFHVIAGVRKQKDADALKRKNLEPVLLDVTKEESVDAALAALRPQLEKAEEVHLINNAGIAVAGPVEAVPMRRWEEQFNVNVLGLVRATQAFLPFIRATKGRIINISSVAGISSNPYLGPYCASKHAVEAISDALRMELRQFGVKVIVVEPGPIATPIWQKGVGQAEDDTAGLDPKTAKAYASELEKFRIMVKISVKRAVGVEKVSDVVMDGLLSARPRIRYVVGPKYMPTAVKIASHLPDRWIDALVAQQFKKEFRPRAAHKSAD
jgi:NAD(P)-dependent dehydrogenase (short-subunit alcohol dehydrogenase family)